MASKRAQRRKQCESKRRHDTEDSAWAAVRGTIRLAAFRENGKGLGVYHCRRCGGWHVGHRPGSLSRIARRS